MITIEDIQVLVSTAVRAAIIALAWLGDFSNDAATIITLFALLVNAT